MTYEQYSQPGQEDVSSGRRDGLGTTGDMRARAQETFDNAREQATSGLDSIVDAAAAAAEELREHNQEGLSRYVSDIADNVSSIAGSLRHKSVDELIHDVGAVARKNPTLFLAGSLIVGLGIGRFARSSAKHQQQENELYQAGRSESYRSNFAGDAYPEYAENDRSQRVTEEDYLADDFAFSDGEDIDIENGDFSISRNSGQSQSNPEITSTPTARHFSSTNKNRPIGGEIL